MTKKKISSPKKAKRLKNNLKRTILQYAEGKRYSPMRSEELMAQLAVPDSLKSCFLEVLTELVQEKKLSYDQKRYQSFDSHSTLVQGTISIHPIKGFGFISVLGSEQTKDIFIPKQWIAGAVDGDTVEAEITGTTAKGPEGRVIAVLKRSRSFLACTVLEKTKEHTLAYSPLLGGQKAVVVEELKKNSLNKGDRIICHVSDWNAENQRVLARFERKIGHISDPSCDIAAAIAEFELPDGFSKESVEEAKAFGSKVESKGRADLTHLETVTIDPATAKDFDDAISLTQDEKGHFFLGVHIADAAFYVKEGSNLDKEAFLRCNSTYFPGFCLPMLPFHLSNNLCSLKPKVKRLTISVLMELDPSGEVLDYEIIRGCIQSKRRFSYEEAFEILEKKKKSPYFPLLKRMTCLCNQLKRKRRERGSIDFAMAENKIVVDEHGVPLGIERVEYDITHQMIEEFMLKANEIVSVHLANIGKEQIFRIHQEPDPETFEDFYAYARTLGFKLPAKPKVKDLQRLFEEAKESPLISQLSVHFIRSMKQALYSPDNLGHYGLALEYYCHFTSPIRRYTDLITQRLLFGNLDCDLSDIAKTCSEKERLSMRAENSVLMMKKLRLAQNAIQEDSSKIYSATITKVKPFALFFEVAEFALESSIHVSEIGNDFFEYNPKTLTFKGARSGKTFSSGSSLKVQLLDVDLIRQSAHWKTVR